MYRKAQCSGLPAFITPKKKPQIPTAFISSFARGEKQTRDQPARLKACAAGSSWSRRASCPSTCLMLKGHLGVCCFLQREKAELHVPRLSVSCIFALTLAVIFPASSPCQFSRSVRSRLLAVGASFTSWEIIFFHKSKLLWNLVPGLGVGFFENRILPIHSRSEKMY